MQGKTPPPLMDVAVRIDFLNLSPASGNLKDGAFIPYEYVEDENLRLRLYQRISALAEKKEIALIKKEIKRSIRPPACTRSTPFIDCPTTHHRCQKRHHSYHRSNGQVMLNTDKGFITQGGQHPRLEGIRPTERLKELIQLL